MPTNYNGNDAAVTARAAVQISVPADADPQNAAAYNPALQELADIADHLETKAGLLDVASTWTGVQTFAANIPLTGSNPSGTTGFANTLTPLNIIKAYGNIFLNGVGSSAAGFNFSSFAFNGNDIDITLATGVGNSTDNNRDVAISFSTFNNFLAIFSATWFSTTTFRIRAWDAAGSIINLSGATSVGVMFTLVGRQ
jgi:hypothetical protein